jgi:hypothetical protein
MLDLHSAKIMRHLNDDDVVLDIGGWGHPFNRANHVIDMGSYETRGYYNRTFASTDALPPLGGTKEFFTKETWIQRDICDREPFPFRDKEIDYVICSHTLEDIRDPLWVCAEMNRIGKRGYIETPSRVLETCRGWESLHLAGLSHHRWLVELKEGTLTFTQKYHMIHERELSFPAWYTRLLTDEQKYCYLFWEGGFAFKEQLLHGEDQRKYLQSLIDTHLPRPAWNLRAINLKRLWQTRLERRIFSPLQILLHGSRKPRLTEKV